MTDNKLKDIFTKEKITAIKQYIERSFPDYQIHHDGYNFDRISWNYSLSNKDKNNDRIFFVTVRRTFFEDQNESEISRSLCKCNLKDYFGDSIKRIVVDYKGGKIIIYVE